MTDCSKNSLKELSFEEKFLINDENFSRIIIIIMFFLNLYDVYYNYMTSTQMVLFTCILPFLIKFLLYCSNLLFPGEQYNDEKYSIFIV